MSGLQSAVWMKKKPSAPTSLLERIGMLEIEDPELEANEIHR
jgi:hypothetical protein